MEKVDGTSAAKPAEAVKPVATAKQNGNSYAPQELIDSKSDRKAGMMSKIGEVGVDGAARRSKIESFVAKAVPDITTEATVTSAGGKTIIDAGAGDDSVSVTQDPGTGVLTVNVNGAEREFKGSSRDNIVIRAGDGNDVIRVGENVTVKLTLEGEAGRDRIYVDEKVAEGQVIEGGAGNDILIGGGGRDYINGSDGNDFIMGRGGNDVAYAGDGDDYVSGGDGDDYLEAGKGNDHVRGWAGNDNISGGRGDDRIFGGDGDDVLYAGEGKDAIRGEGGANKIFSQTEDSITDKTGVTNTVVEVDMSQAIGGSVVIKGSDAFRERIEQDLDFLRSSPTGRKMLAGFDETKHTVTIQEFDQQNGTAFPTNRVDTSFDTPNQKPGKTDDATFNINPDFYPADHIPPIVVFYHEMAHAWDYTHGTLRTERYNGSEINDRGIRDAERVAVGQPIDHDKDPATAEIHAPEHPRALTENALREELNRRLRPRYTSL